MSWFISKPTSAVFSDTGHSNTANTDSAPRRSRTNADPLNKSA